MTAPLIVVPGRHPFEISMFIGSFVAGVWGLFVPDGRSNAIDMVFPSWFVVIYYAHLAVWGAVALLVLCVRELERRLRLERVALYGVGYSALAYMISALYATGAKAGTAAFIAGAVALASTWRILQITGELHRLQETKASIEEDA